LGMKRGHIESKRLNGHELDYKVGVI